MGRYRSRASKSFAVLADREDLEESCQVHGGSSPDRACQERSCILVLPGVVSGALDLELDLDLQPERWVSEDQVGKMGSGWEVVDFY